MILIVKGICKLSKKGSLIIVRCRGAENREDQVLEVPLIDLELLVVVGSSSLLSSGVINMLSTSGIPLLIHDREGDSLLMSPYMVGIADLRRKFYVLTGDDRWKIYIGKRFVEGKILGMVNVARYFTYLESDKGGEGSNREQLRSIRTELDRIIKEFKLSIGRIDNISELMNLEAVYSSALWRILSNFIPKEYRFPGRKPRAEDPINRAIDYTYAILYSISWHALIASGLDPYAGIVHKEIPGRPSLVYDFTEMVKPAAIHSVIVTSRSSEITLDKRGMLSKKSLESCTINLNRILKKKIDVQQTLRSEIYRKAFMLKDLIVKGTEFTPLIYKPKI